jgi:uncharacterized LabA/DUF88 family protein
MLKILKKHSDKTTCPKKLHIFVDGSWLYRVYTDGILDKEFALYDEIKKTNKFNIDFNKLKLYILEHTKKTDPDVQLGDCYFISSIFHIAKPDELEGETNDINKIKEKISDKNIFADKAIAGGFQDSVIRPELKSWHIESVLTGDFREKQVDIKLAALFTKYAVTTPCDYFAIITGDSDFVPAIDISGAIENVILVTTHPDESDKRHIKSSRLLTTLNFRIAPIYLRSIAKYIMKGMYIYECIDCKKFFSLENAIKDLHKFQPHCKKCKPDDNYKRKSTS